MLPLLTRYLLGDLLRAILLTTAILATVIAFRAAIKPLANDRLLSAGQVAKYIMLAMVPMLQFALPFASGFAATISFHRLSTDNEIVAMSAGGISYKRILAPVAGLGLALMVIMLALTHFYIPRFWSMMQATIATDVTRIFEATLSRREPFQFGNIQVYADDIVVVDGPEDSTADTRIHLLRGAAAEMDDQGRIVTDVTFSQGAVDVAAEGIILKLVMADAVVFNGVTGQMSSLSRVEPGAFPVAHVLQDEIVAKTFLQLRELRRDPSGFASVREARVDLVETLRMTVILETIDRRLRETGQVVFTQPGPDEKTYIVRADRMQGVTIYSPLDTGVHIDVQRDEEIVRQYDGGILEVQRSGVLGGGIPEGEASLAFDVLLRNTNVTDLGVTNPRAELGFYGLVIPGLRVVELADMSGQELLVLAGEAGHSQVVKNAAERLRSRIDEIERNIVAQTGQRYALSVTAPLLVMLGATLAIWLRRKTPLTVYVWAFLPSVADLILISGGTHILVEGRWIGWAVIWSGNLLLLLILLFAYSRLARN